MSPALYLVTPPTDVVLSAANVKAASPSLAGADDAVIEAIVAAAVNQLDPAGGGWLGRALRPQTWEVRLPGFCCYQIVLPYPPLISITSFKYDDTSGVEQTLSVGTGYRIFGQGTLGRAKLQPPYQGCWPTSRCDVESVRIRFQCGYPPGDAEADPVVTETLPAPIRQAIILMVKDLYFAQDRDMNLQAENVEGVYSRRFNVTADASKAMQEATANLLANLRVWG